MTDKERYLQLAAIQKETLLTEAEMEEYIEISTRILFDMLETDESKEILTRLRNR